MIDLYVATNTNYEMNGNMELLPTSCIVDAEINGTWSLSLIHPIDEENRWSYLSEGAVLKVKSFNGAQLFRIKRVEKQDSGCQVFAEPIFLDAVGDCFLYDIRPTNKTGQQALDMILSPNAKYSGSSNIAKQSTAYFILKNALESIAGNEENSFLNRWGGEIEYNNHQIIINERLGADNGIELLYGKNIPTDGMREIISIEEVVTRVVPKAFNGRLISSGNKYVNSPLINNYPTITTKVVEYPSIKLAEDVEGDTQEGDIICNTQAELNEALRNAADHEFSEGNIDKPLISIECDMVLLQNTEEYRDFASLETVSLGDTIHCNHSRLGIKTDARINAISWDCLNESVLSVKIGSIMPTYESQMASIITEISSSVANTAVNNQNQEDIFNKLTQNGQTQGIYLYNGDIYINGTYIKAGTIDANLVKAGIIRDKQNKNSWNLDTGAFSTNGAIQSGGTITGASINNGSGTFQVDANGNLKASSAEITGDIKSGSTISGSSISGGTITGSFVTTSGEDTDFNYTSSLDNGKIVFTRTGKTSATYDGTISIEGGALVADFDTAGAKSTITNVIRVENKTSGAMASLLPGSISVKRDANNYVNISTNNIEIYVNGSKVWSAR